MNPLTIVLLHSGTDDDLRQLYKHLPALEKYLNEGDSFWGRKVRLEVLTGYLRTVESSITLAQDLAQRNDILAVSFWGGVWLAPNSSKCVQAFLEESIDSPFIVLSGTVLDEHRNHPGSFSLAPVMRDKDVVIRNFIGELPDGAKIGYIGKEGHLEDVRSTVVSACQTHGLHLELVLLPAEFPNTEPEEHDFLRACECVESTPECDYWFLSLNALNRPLRAWLYQNNDQVTIMSLNAGKKLNWFKGKSDVGDIFIGQDGDREKLDVVLTRSLALESGFPRWRVDSLLLIKKAAALSPFLPKTASPTEMFDCLKQGVQAINGREAVFEGTKFCFWFDPESRFNGSGAICLKWRLGGEDKNILHYGQFRPLMDGSISRIPVVYFYVDMLTITDVNLSQKLFSPTFYLDMRSTDDITLDDLYFVNAITDSINASLLINHIEYENSVKFHVRRYKVSGNFNFSPQLKDYPLDHQFVELEMAPINPLEKDFLLQPIPEEKHDVDFDIAGWSIEGGDISSHTRFWYLPTSSKFQMQYKAYRAVSFGWFLKRQSLDTLFRIGIPLGILLFISYFPVLSRQEQSGEMTGLLITALLAVIALYFATDKPSTDRMSMMDRIFRTSYVAIGLLLATILIATHLPENIYSVLMNVWAFVYPAILLGEGWSSYRKYRREGRAHSVD